jgi:NAD(P)-dependent dehydrogenase (short-subunit alcohol dehydrogenase family)
MSKDTDMKTILIVGASRGLGLGLVAEHLKRGFAVIATVRKAADEADLKALPGAERLTLHHLDVTSDDDIARLAKALPADLDIAFINAGISGPKSVVTASADELNQIMQANVFGPVRLAHALLGTVRPKTGILAFTSSIMGSIAARAAAWKSIAPPKPPRTASLAPSG